MGRTECARFSCLAAVVGVVLGSLLSARAAHHLGGSSSSSNARAHNPVRRARDRFGRNDRRNPGQRLLRRIGETR